MIKQKNVVDDTIEKKAKFGTIQSYKEYAIEEKVVVLFETELEPISSKGSAEKFRK